MPAPPVPDWQLPTGVTRGLWEYLHDPQIAREYDRSIAQSGLTGYDAALLHERLLPPGRLVDLGCGSGRHAVACAARGFEVTAVDLSTEMLDVCRAGALAAGVSLRTLQANLCDLHALADADFDVALCLFSTLGMIGPEAARRAALREFQRVLRPGGRLLLHVHNLWFNIYTPGGRHWLWGDRWRAWVRRQPGGDRVSADRGIPNMVMHVFTAGELRRLLTSVGFRIDELIPLTPRGEGRLPRSAWGTAWRASGWIADCTRV